jgi:CheY-like chemotaxis protein
MNKKILIVEDDEAIIDSTKLLLEFYDYKVAVSNGKDIFSQIESNKPDVILLDVWMPGIDGRQICQKIKNDRKLSNIPIILISASRNLDKTAKDFGAEDFIQKPFEVDDLIAMINKYT